ncbi:hypothetical protein VE00_10067 [Pseudogymnoascus sp. WSF 3629]|nr:hypothetical protein VE00_10067 [Pseudogymnoascus sp. WSF 3629]
MPSPTQHPPRPFLSNFLAAFRARSSFQPTKQQSTTTSTTTQPPSPSSQPSHPRTITPPKSHNHPTTSALSALHSPPLSRSPGTSPGYMSTMANSAAARRRGSESEGEGGGGFREIGSSGGEKCL